MTCGEDVRVDEAGVVELPFFGLKYLEVTGEVGEVCFFLVVLPVPLEEVLVGHYEI